MTRTRLLCVAAVVGSATLALAALGTAASQKTETYKLSAKLTRAQEVPKPNAPSGAKGTFTGTSVERSDKTTLKWKLTFSGLSGKATAAHIHLAKRGKAGPVAVPLCGPCTSGEHGTTKIKRSVERAMEHGTAYVNVHTAKNKNGEIRGQIKATEQD
jgi:hypothetical protein